MNLCNDQIIQHADTLFYFKYLEWDTHFFCRPAYQLDVEKSSLIPNNEINALLVEKIPNSFITVKLSTNTDCKTLAFLQECNFQYIDTEVVLQHHILLNKIIKNEIVTIKKVEINTDLPYNELGSIFTHTRFHCDIHIPHHKADNLWIEYLKNFIPNDKKHMFIAKISNDVAGIILVNIVDTVAYLFFVSVLEPYQSMQVGTQLIQHVIKYYTDTIIQTGTQIKNVGALNFYLKNGFSKIIQTNTVMHCWTQK